MSQPIPIKNLYHLLCYAWDVLPQADLIDVNFNDEDHPLDLLAEVLIKGTHHLLRRGLDQDYQQVSEVISTLRGRVDFACSGRRLLLNQGKALCHFDEISSNILPNQILKTTFVQFSKSTSLNKKLRHQCGVLTKQLAAIDAIPLRAQIFGQVRLHRNNRFYRFLLNVCELVFLENLLNENTGDYRFQDFFRDEGKMPRLYEKFIYNFYKQKQRTFKVSSDKINWRATSVDDPELTLLPTMLTDVSLRSQEKTIILDAKYYKDTLSHYYGKSRIRTTNLYQISTYLQNIGFGGGNDAKATGILLYPVTSLEHSVGYELNGKEIRIETINLAAEWSEIEKKLLDIIH